MKKILSILVTSFALTASCAHVPAPIKDFGQCLSTSVSTQTQDILSEVELDLASASYISLLTDLGKRIGFTVLDCAVAEVKQRSTARFASAPSDTLSKDKSDRAASWLAR